MAEAFVHPSAVVSEGARFGKNVKVGPFCVIGPDVVLADGVELKSHVVIAGDTEIGAETIIYPFASIGEVPQDLKFKGEKTRLVIGARNRIRENVTMNPGTEGGGGITRIGDDCLFMAGAHVAHDCVIGDRVILVNHASIAGHCQLGDDVIVGGLSGVHQFVRIGRGAMIGAVTMVTADVIPFGLVQGSRGALHGLNLIGLKRRGATREDIQILRDMLSELSRGSFREAARQRLESSSGNAKEREVLEFILGPSDRSFLAPHAS